MLPKHPLLQKCLKALEAIPTFQTTVGAMPYVTADFLADGQLFIENAQGKAEYIYEIKSDVTRDTIDAVIQYFGSLQQRLPGKTRALLITHQLSDQTVDRLVEKEIEFVDATGNIYLNSPRNYVLVRRPTDRDRRSPSTEVNSSTIQLMYLLLRDPGILRGDHVEPKLADLAEMTAPTIQKHLTRLEDLGYLQRKRKGYKIVDYFQLFERWELGYAEVLRSELLIGTFSYKGSHKGDEVKTLSQISQKLVEITAKKICLVGGEWAAGNLVGDFRSPYATLYLQGHSKAVNEETGLFLLTMQLGLKADPEGEITILRQFNHANAWLEEPLSSMADPLLIHAELNLSHDARVRTVAQRLFDQHIAPRSDA
jgi:hypothetical protein